MELKDFISNTLKDIVEGVVAAQAHVGTRRASVNSSDYANRDHARLAQEILFDVAVTTTETSHENVKAGIFVAPLGLGVKSADRGFKLCREQDFIQHSANPACAIKKLESHIGAI